MKNYLFTILIPIALFCVGCHKESDKTLPIMGRKDVQQTELNGTLKYDTVYHTIPEFQFVNQDSLLVTHHTFDDKIYVADFFFTTCPTICPVMKTQMLRVYEKYKDNDEVLILSHSIDPVHDTVAVLKAFSDKLGVDSKKWYFVTGNKNEIYTIGEKSYLVTAQEDGDAPGGYIHSGAFILIDKEKRIRGMYDGTEEDEVDRLMKDIQILMKEYDQ